MKIMKVLFFTGNKRSGTSQLVRLLNLHSQIYVSHESDVIWILYQFHNEIPFASHPWDSPKGMKITLEACGNILKKNSSPQENFFALQRCVMEKGHAWLPPMQNKELLWIGDKKPFQLTDPLLIDFVLKLFPDAHFIHLVRHPFDVAMSAERFNKTPYGDFWKDLTLEEKVTRWAFHEKQVLDFKRSGRARVLDVRYEDLCQHPGSELVKILEFLNMDIQEQLVRKARRDTCYVIKNRPYISHNNETLDIMQLYGYSPQFIKEKQLNLFLMNVSSRLRKYLKEI